MKSTSALITIVSMALLVTACKSNRSMAKIDGDATRFSLYKGACFGQCPTYELTITQDGLATLEGRAFMDKLGTYTKQIPKDEMKKLEQAFATSDFQNFKDEYPSQLVDLPIIKIGYDNGSGMKIVSGRDNRPEALMQLQFALERVADSGEWTLIKAQAKADPTAKPEIDYIYEEIIIEPKPGTQMAKWIDSMQPQGVRIIKKIAPGLEYYLITYDPSKIKAKALLKMLQSDDRIQSAEFNKKTRQRQR